MVLIADHQAAGILDLGPLILGFLMIDPVNQFFK